jgi:signal transduction histidine kinase
MNAQARIRLYLLILTGLVLSGIALSMLGSPMAQGAVAGFAVGLTLGLVIAARLQQMNQAKDTFLAMLGHELRNPLAPIQNSIYLLKKRGQDEETRRHSLEIIERQTKQLTRLIDDLLDVSRIIQGKLTLKREQVELGEVMKRAVECTEALIQSRQHTLSVDSPTLPLALGADPARLEQVLVNLLTNAAKYTEPGGRIWLQAERRESEIIVRVRDTGIGIPVEMRRHLFQPFRQIEGSRNQSQGGLGLGLALVRGLIELHGGSVELDSAGRGQGSTFTLHLPAAPADGRSRKTEVQDEQEIFSGG